VSSADVPAAIANGGTGYRLSTDDWTDALNWISVNTEPDAVVASWWDYGYWITTLGNRATLADNATINSTRIETIAKMLISDEQSGIKIAQDLKADYIVIYIVGQVRYIGTANAEGTNSTAGQTIPIYTLGQGGDESKKQWFMRIGGFDEHKYIEPDGFTPTPEFWNSTLLGRLIPFELLSYVPIGAEGGAAEGSAVWRQGLTGLYAQNVKYPADGAADQPLHLVYSSPSFNDKESIMFGVFIYKVNQESGPGLTTSNDIAVIETTQGTIKIEFFPEAAPDHVDNFISLAKKGFYDGTLFHRIVPGFVIQGGDPNTASSTDRDIWGQGGPGYTIEAEFNDIPHDRGIVSMARAMDPDSAGSQFFIVLRGDDLTKGALDNQYTVFGRVIEGMDVVDKIAAVETIVVGGNSDNRQPADPEAARILSVEIVAK
ncbi:MAG: peptidylprolyl isomerase, partial [Nitrososphaera sp.]